MKCSTLNRGLSAALVASLFAWTNCFAADSIRSLEVDVDSLVNPASAVGLVISSEGTIQRPSTKIEKTARDSIVVTFEIPQSQLRPDSVASALVVSEKGEVVFGNVKPILSPETDQALGNLPLCPGDSIPVASLAGQYSVLEKIYAIRMKRRDQARATIEKTLSEDLLVRLQKLERGFGLAREKELNPQLSALELVDRLSRLRDALRNWEGRAESIPTPAPQAPHLIGEAPGPTETPITTP